MSFRKAGRVALHDGALQVEIDGIGRFSFDDTMLVGADGKPVGYVLPSTSGKAVNLHMGAGQQYTVIRTQLLGLAGQRIQKAAVFEVA
jgi:hypothetical protein